MVPDVVDAVRDAQEGVADWAVAPVRLLAHHHVQEVAVAAAAAAMMSAHHRAHRAVVEAAVVLVSLPAMPAVGLVTATVGPAAMDVVVEAVAEVHRAVVPAHPVALRPVREVATLALVAAAAAVAVEGVAPVDRAARPLAHRRAQGAAVALAHAMEIGAAVDAAVVGAVVAGGVVADAVVTGTVAAVALTSHHSQSTLRLTTLIISSCLSIRLIHQRIRPPLRRILSLSTRLSE